jgi:hypothetical protein
MNQLHTLSPQRPRNPENALMETSTDREPVAGWFDPLTGWEAASRWNRATFDWVAKGWQQWVALMTTVPPHWVVPRENDDAPAPDALAPRLRVHALAGRAMAKEASKRPAKPATRKKTTKKAATRG